MPTFPVSARFTLPVLAPRSFGSRRDGGRRKHAGVDLYASVGTPVRACEAGIVRAVYPFYLGTWAIEVRHADGRVIRYGEVAPDTKVKAGQRVNEGDVIGSVGTLQGLDVSMLHFELYSGSAKGPLTNIKAPPFFRRADLIDPTEYLASCSS